MGTTASLARALGSTLDVVTAGYRIAHHKAVGPGGVAPSLVAPMTWLLGTFLTVFCLITLAVAWDLLFWVLRLRGRRLLARATLGLNLRHARILVEQFVRLDRVAGLMQQIARVRRERTDRSAPDAFTDRVRGSRRAALLLLVPLAIAWIGRGVRYLFGTIWGLLTFLATWWAMGHPGLHEARAELAHGHTGTSIHLTTIGLSAVGVSVAALTFVLSRLRSARVVGHQNWRRTEAVNGCDELAEREIAISKALTTLHEAEWEIHGSWRAAIWRHEEFTDQELADHESELRELLELDPSPVARLPRIDPAEVTAPDRDAAVMDAVASLQELRRYVEEITTRREDRIWSAAPLRLVRQTSRLSLLRAIARIDPYLSIRAETHLRLRSPLSLARGLAAKTTGHVALGPDLGDFDPSSVPEPDRLAVLAAAMEEWQSEVDRARRLFESEAHNVLIRALIGIAELRAASNAIFTFLHPVGPITKLREWLRPT